MTPRAPVTYLQVILYSRSLLQGVNKPLTLKALLTCPSMASFGLSLRPNNSWISMEKYLFQMFTRVWRGPLSQRNNRVISTVFDSITRVRHVYMYEKQILLKFSSQLLAVLRFQKGILHCRVFSSS